MKRKLVIEKKMKRKLVIEKKMKRKKHNNQANVQIIDVTAEKGETKKILGY